jgi:hypothetical protein
MRKHIITIIIGLSALTCLTAGITSAKSKTTAERITITGSGLTKTIQVTDPVTLQNLSLMRLENFEQPIEPPENIGPGYTIIRYFHDGENTQQTEHPNALLDTAEEVQFQRQQGFRPIDKVRYHPDPAGDLGYIFYEQLNLNIIVPYEGNWYRATKVGDATIQHVLSENDVLLPPHNTPLQSWLICHENRPITTLFVSISAGLLCSITLLLWKRKQTIIKSG